MQRTYRISSPINNYLLLIVLLTLVILFYQCEKGVEPDNEKYIYGYVYLDSTETVEDILVRIIQTGDSAYTNGYGKYKFSSLEPDTYTIVASMDGYDPSFTIFFINEIQRYRISDLILTRSPCLSSDSIPPGYPLGVFFNSDDSYTVSVDKYYIGDILYIDALEYYMPPYVTYTSVQDDYDQDLIIVSSIGDREKTPVYRVLGSVPSQWRFAYLIESCASQLPTSYNGIIEVEPTGGQITAMYQSWWLRRYVCNSIEIIP